MSEYIYLDNASATPMRPEALEAMAAYSSNWANPSSLHTTGRQAKSVLEESRAALAKRLDVKPVEILFTASATESNNIVSSGVDGQICVLRGEHPSLGAADSKRVIEIDLMPSGIIDLDDLRQKLHAEVSLVAISLVSSSTGVIQPVSEIRKVIDDHEASQPLLHVDASQACGILNIRPHSLGADTMSISGTKAGGPKGAAALYASKDAKLKKSFVGGPQEHGLRPGTQNVPAIAGFVASFEAAEDSREHEYDRLRNLQTEMESELGQQGVVVVGQKTERSPGMSVLLVPGQSNEELLYKLDLAGIAIGIGSACHATSHEPNRTLSAMGLGPQDIRSSIRISLGWQNTPAHVASFVAALCTAIDELALKAS